MPIVPSAHKDAIYLNISKLPVLFQNELGLLHACLFFNGGQAQDCHGSSQVRSSKENCNVDS